MQDARPGGDEIAVGPRSSSGGSRGLGETHATGQAREMALAAGSEYLEQLLAAAPRLRSALASYVGSLRGSRAYIARRALPLLTERGHELGVDGDDRVSSGGSVGGRVGRATPFMGEADARRHPAFAFAARPRSNVGQLRGSKVGHLILLESDAVPKDERTQPCPNSRSGGDLSEAAIDLCDQL
jgi:hypothetical protein